MSSSDRLSIIKARQRYEFGQRVRLAIIAMVLRFVRLPHSLAIRRLVLLFPKDFHILFHLPQLLKLF
jgi:hypothetical protein